MEHEVLLKNYLTRVVSKSESLRDILDIIKEVSKASGVSIFNYMNSKYHCIEFIPKSDNLPRITYPYISETCYDISAYSHTGHEISKCAMIPIKTSDFSSLLCILNSKLDNITEIMPYIGLLQIVLGKYAIDRITSKDIFLANISHEIRTPLNGIIGYIQLLIQTNLDSTQKGYINSMNHCSLQLMHIINDILDFSRISSGKMTINTDCFTINEVITYIKDTLGSRIKDKNQDLNFVVSSNLPAYIISDKQIIIQILVNLISNAYKFTKIKGRIDVNFESVESNMLKIQVRDNGVGISPEDQNKIFSAFEQLNQTSISNSGAGLGLAITSNLCKLLNGNITVQSELNKGSTFTAIISYKSYDSYETLIKKNSKTLKNKVALIVDDNIDNRIVLSELLFEWGMRPIVCASPLEALRMILGNRYKFNVGLIDICMPAMSGPELAKQIKDELPYLPLIALSSMDNFTLSTEFDRKLDKPVNKMQLYMTLYNTLSKSNSVCLGESCNSSDDEYHKSPVYNSLKIMVVDDNYYSRNLLVNMLKNLKFTFIDEAENGEDAISKIKTCDYDIVFLDLRMPVLDGIGFIKQNIFPIHKIAVITASTMDEDKTECSDLGVKYFINKPVQFNQLKEVVYYITK